MSTGRRIVGVAALGASAVLAGCATTSAGSARRVHAAAPGPVVLPSTTVALAPTASPPTAVPPGAPIPAQVAAPGQSRLEALDAVVDRLGPVYAVSPFASGAGTLLVAVDHDQAVASGGSEVAVDVYAWDAGALDAQAEVALGQGGATGVLLPAAGDQTPITVVGVTGGPDPDFAVTTAAADAELTTIVSNRSGTWRAVPWETPSGPTIAVPSATVRGTQATAVFSSCTPTCVQGSQSTVTFTYRDGEMVPST